MKDALNKRIEESNRRNNKKIAYFFFLMCLYGLLLPTDWRSILWPFSELISWVADFVPAAREASSVSSIPDLVRGYIGFAAIGTVAFAIALCHRDPLGDRVKRGFNRSSSSTVGTGLFIYLIGAPTLVLFLWFIFFLPDVESLVSGKNYAAELFRLAINNRIALSIVGAIVTTGMGLLVYFLAVIVIGPFYIPFSRSEQSQGPRSII